MTDAYLKKRLEDHPREFALIGAQRAAIKELKEQVAILEEYKRLYEIERQRGNAKDARISELENIIIEGELR